MMRRTKYRLLLITALLHLFADVAFAGGAILCVGSNDHLAIEVEHSSPGGCQTASDSNLFEVDVADDSSQTEDCVDRPLHSEAELLSSSEDASDLIPNVIAIDDHLYGFDLDSVRLSCSIQRGPSLAADLRAHRTTVLLL